jgi:hypothetical protein
MPKVLFALLLIAAALLSSCISSADLTNEKRFAMLFNVDNIGEELVIDQDTLYISELKFSLDRLSLRTDSDIDFETVSSITAMIFAYNDQLEGDRLIIEVGLGVSDDLAFNHYNMFLEPVASRNNVFDTDFFGESTNFSVIIKGVINEEEFEFRSNGEFEKEYIFDRVEVNSLNETLVLSKSIDVGNLFTGSDGSFIDPRISENDELILNGLNTHLELTVTADDIY